MRSHYESTDNAYVPGNVVQITPQVGGTVIAINADDTDCVQGRPAAGQARPGRRARSRCEQAEAQLAQTVREVRTLYANNGALAANVARAPAREAERARASDDLTRRQPLVGTGAVSREEIDARRATRAAERAECGAGRRAREQLASTRR